MHFSHTCIKVATLPRRRSSTSHHPFPLPQWRASRRGDTLEIDLKLKVAMRHITIHNASNATISPAKGKKEKMEEEEEEEQEEEEGEMKECE